MSHFQVWSSNNNEVLFSSHSHTPTCIQGSCCLHQNNKIYRCLILSFQFALLFFTFLPPFFSIQQSSSNFRFHVAHPTSFKRKFVCLAATQSNDNDLFDSVLQATCLCVSENNRINWPTCCRLTLYKLSNSTHATVSFWNKLVMMRQTCSSSFHFKEQTHRTSSSYHWKWLKLITSRLLSMPATYTRKLKVL